MTTLLLSHSACLNHLTPPGHPERPDRLRAIESALEAEKFAGLIREQAPMADIEMVALALKGAGLERWFYLYVALVIAMAGVATVLLPETRERGLIEDD